jgi:hypothetical protein
MKKIFTTLTTGLMIIAILNSCFLAKSYSCETVKASGDSSKNYALIIQGTSTDLDGDPSDNPEVEYCFSVACGKAYSAFGASYHKEQLYRPKTRDNDPETKDIKYMITEDIPAKLGDNKQVFIFITAHGDDNGYMYFNYGQIFPNVKPDELNKWLGDMEKKCNPSKVIVVIDSCYSGISAKRLGAQNRIIITSTDSDFSATVQKTDSTCKSFSIAYFDNLIITKNYGLAWKAADKFIDDGTWINPKQNPQINDNGDTVSSGTAAVDNLPFLSSGDGSVALGTRVSAILKPVNYRINIFSNFLIKDKITSLIQIFQKICYTK